MAEKMLNRVCIIIGSGASVPYGLPTLASLPKHVRRFVDTECEGPLVEIYQDACLFVDALWGLDLTKDWIDYEELLGVLSYIIRIGGYVRTNSRVLSRHHLARLLEGLPGLLFCAIDQNTFEMKNNNTIVLKKSPDIYRLLLDRCWSSELAKGHVPVLSCISLNYDCLLDDEMTDHIWGIIPESQLAVDNLHFLPCYFLDFAQVTDGLHLAKQEQYKWTLSRHHELIKLHGSFDWLICSNCGAVHNVKFFRSYLSRRRIASLPKEVREIAESLVCRVCCGPLDQRLVAPILGKTEDSVVRLLWDAAFKSLATANMIIVVGYSFPPSDLAFRTLVQHALNWNERKPEIRVIDPNADIMFWSRLEAIFPQNRISKFSAFKQSVEQYLSETT